MIYVAAVLYILATATAFRFYGGGYIEGVPKIVRLIVRGTVLTAPVWFITDWWWAAATLLSVTAGAAPGHGAYFNLGRNPSSYNKHETIWKFFTEWMQEYYFGKTQDLEKTRRIVEIVGLGLTGLVNTAGFAFSGLYVAAVLGSVLKPLGYEAGWKTRYGTDAGEYIFGALCAIAVIATSISRLPV